MTATGAVTVVKDMALTHREFARGLSRLLPRHAAGWDPSRDGAALRVPWRGGAVEVRLGPESERRIAMMVLPRTSVTLVFEEVAAEDRRGFLAEFDRRFQRGGG